MHSPHHRHAAAVRLACAALALAVAPGCEPPPHAAAVGQRRAADTGAGATLAFAADWSVTTTGALAPGTVATLSYDLARLPDCRATHDDGTPAWRTRTFLATDGGTARELVIATGGADTTVSVPFELPFGHDLAVWFENSDESGCAAWDSDYARNFHFTLLDSGAPVLHFARDWSVTTDGTPAAGADVLVDYDLARLPSCRQTYNGFATWEVEAHYRTDGGPIAVAPLTTVVGMQRLPSAARLALPAGAHDLELWFENVDRTGCHAYDSRYGANFHVALP